MDEGGHPAHHLRHGHPAHRLRQGVEDLRPWRGQRACAGRRRPFHIGGRVRGHHGAVRLGQVDRHEHHRLPRHPDLRHLFLHGAGRWPARPQQPRHAAQPAYRLRLPGLQPAGAHLGAGERGAAAALPRRERGGAPCGVHRARAARAARQLPGPLPGAGRRAPRRQFRAAAGGDLRAQRPHPGRSDLPDRPAAVPQHADVLQHRDAVAGGEPARLRTAPGRRAVPGKGGDAAQPRRRLRADRPQSDASSVASAAAGSRASASCRAPRVGPRCPTTTCGYVAS